METVHSAGAEHEHMSVNDPPLDTPDVDGEGFDAERGPRLEVDGDEGVVTVAVADDRSDEAGCRGDAFDLH